MGTELPGEERESLRQADAALLRHGGVLLHGPRGCGKSFAAHALAALARDRGDLVLAAGPGPGERQLPYSALADLLEPLGPDRFAALPGPRRTALLAASRRQPSPPDGVDALALRLGTLTLLRSLSRDRPVLLVIDPADLVDEDSGPVLAYAARRLDPARVRTLVTETTTPGSSPVTGAALCTGQVREIAVEPLSLPEVSALLAPRALPHRLIRAVHRTSGGNPWYALELARAIGNAAQLPDRDGPLPLTAALRALSVGRLGERDTAVRRVLRLAAYAERPTVELLCRAVAAADRGPVPVGAGDARRPVGAACPDAGSAGLPAMAGTAPVVVSGWPGPRLPVRSGAVRDDGSPARLVARALEVAGRAGLLCVEGELVRFGHPLTIAAFREGDDAERRAAHTALARATADPVVRARHLALAATRPDEALARCLSAAAHGARAHGTLETAAELGRLAHTLTPEGRTEDRVERALAAARLAYDAADYELTRDLAGRVLAHAASPAQRVAACVLVVHAANQALHEAGDAFEQARAHAGDDPRLHAQSHLLLALRAHITDGDTAAARVRAARAAELARQARDRPTELMALSLQAFTATLLGRPDADELLLRALSAPHDPGRTGGHSGPRAVKARLDLFADRTRQAAGELERLLCRARRGGTAEDLIFLLCSSIEVEVRAGRCAAAMSAAREVAHRSREIGVRLGPVPHSLALAEAAGGDLTRSAALAAEGVRTAEDNHDQVFLPLALCVLGQVRLRRGEFAAAVADLGRARAVARWRGIVDPAPVPWAADLVEALVAAGEAEQADALAAETLHTAERLGRRGVYASVLRARALGKAAGGGPAEAVADLRQAVARHRDLELPLETGRDLLALGSVQWRLRHPSAAAAAWRQAADVFQRCGALPWLRRATAELTRFGTPDTPAHGVAATAVLTVAEHRVAALVTDGATNREAAARLFLTVKTVESTLTRVYRKLGVRSRTELARLMRSSGDPRPAAPGDEAHPLP
ncbi:helix-turn-helix transcriptional regulator [Streptantibioticus cattleyicolor]|uniref:Transcriptional regulator n=1 Tax=Streptantibioticus cattleyicolor (strain ATCC 35852 / DSM 46488 / JCM 4925 / NBRC 14057 / NRRL 8057) TaxID=1003195 RepID=F8JKU4_STREN|nr:LuxR family transcriptional regulator [Streptantibioticus cattleyicolor]AEW99701.1 transcriptional regulator [Streptantibioticus cattleyicolor NRRL 8057 = DSM 46488]CCB71261.1 putative transcriptional regulator [Streptantibioticus cattleyicolor NRRL 8057 = DSM 46488]